MADYDGGIGGILYWPLCCDKEVLLVVMFLLDD